MTATQSIDELIALKLQQIELLKELRVQVEFLERAGLKMGDVDRCGYDRSKDERLTRWTATEQKQIGLARVLNYAILKDGTRVDVPIDWKTPRDEYRTKIREAINARMFR